MTIKQRKGKRNKVDGSVVPKDEKYNANKDKEGKKKTRTAGGQMLRKRRKATFGQLLLFLVVVFSVAGVILYSYYAKYGITVLLGRSFADYRLTPFQWRKFIDENEKTILIIGGPHRSGTTIVWEAIKQHPEIAGFGDRFETGVDYSEGVLFQEVYPRFGVGLEFKKNFGLPGRAKGEDEEKQDGLGRYALLPEHEVHWTKENKREKATDPNILSSLLNRFAPYWDKIKKFDGKDGLQKAKVWVEKSPQNGVLTSFLESVYNMPVLEDGSVDTTGASKNGHTCTKFLFMTRHPIANIYAIDIFVQESMGGFIDFEILLRNYIQMHKYMKMDEKMLESKTKWTRLEDFATDPSEEMREIFKFLEVASDDNTIDEILDSIAKVKADPNKKYFQKWCKVGIQEHGHLLDKYGEDLSDLGLDYDLYVC